MKFLKSKSYGLTKKEGSLEYLWSIKNHPIIKELGFEAPRSDIHKYKYDHEKLCAEIFVCLMVAGSISAWGKKQLSKEVKPDRYFKMSGRMYYLEAEMGNHKEPIIRAKVEAYKKYFRETQEPFNVLFVMAKDEDLGMVYAALDGAPKAYEAVSLSQLQTSISSSIRSSPPEE